MSEQKWHWVNDVSRGFVINRNSIFAKQTVVAKVVFPDGSCSLFDCKIGLFYPFANVAVALNRKGYTTFREYAGHLKWNTGKWKILANSKKPWTKIKGSTVYGKPFNKGG